MADIAPPSTPPRAPPTRPSPAAAARPAVAVPSFARLSPKPIAPRIALLGVEGWGKTSIGAHAPGAAIIMARGETGYVTLVNAGRVPVVNSTVADSWDGLLALLDQIGTVTKWHIDQPTFVATVELGRDHQGIRLFSNGSGDSPGAALVKALANGVADHASALARARAYEARLEAVPA